MNKIDPYSVRKDALNAPYKELTWPNGDGKQQQHKADPTGISKCWDKYASRNIDFTVPPKLTESK